MHMYTLTYTDTHTYIYIYIYMNEMYVHMRIYIDTYTLVPTFDNPASFARVVFLVALV